MQQLGAYLGPYEDICSKALFNDTVEMPTFQFSLLAILADFSLGVLCYSGMFEDDTFVYMIEPLELTHDEVGL